MCSPLPCHMLHLLVIGGLHVVTVIVVPARLSLNPLAARMCTQDFQETAQRQMAALRRSAAKERHELEVGWQLKVNFAENIGVQAVWAEADRRRTDMQRRAAEMERSRAECAAARAESEALLSRLQQEQAATQRLRNSRSRPECAARC